MNGEDTNDLTRYAERIWHLAVELSLFACRQGNSGRGMAVVAAETQRIARLLEDQAASAEALGDGGIDRSEILDQLVMLTLNGSLEAAGLEEHLGNPLEAAAALYLLEELRGVAGRLANLVRGGDLPLMALPELARASSVCQARLKLLHARVAGLGFAEPLHCIKEIVRFDPTDGTSLDAARRLLTVRERQIPFIGSLLTGQAYRPPHRLQQALIVRADWHQPHTLYAVPVDDLAVNCIQLSAVGQAQPGASAGLPATVLREWWPAEGGESILFLDWPALHEAGL
ncbi:MAG: hypothetical protein A2087_12870 [Spirochaetes bacterium GWD1_61_31]|nr:MAG: hypothetical protein A2Y37_02230 [Spirochaetes bacterium GWB1_60_80]OHD35034.1 MAG: hypothetical protein A2004_00840 [Spirochaetes bacterium GWC1_61_12]OHD35649.1 MAG: hypothetical protein A2087_12870 [Spirochaetes bacterium GWD1_61_31]OHD41745.1 MAG: hypothetical protein A2Y35_09100 [Spirochaetes bacterium GWE1_60_18]OHD61604.1 MAG: hypothetical protein A2Y32_01410 [Spirochaetes bacterium GWF1_60_12]HAP44035.1 hypothetical protein [Spirochaetaceae bacterium]